MTDTQTLISTLSREVAPSAPMPTPRYWALRLVAVLMAYGVVTQWVLGIRPDLAMQWTRPLFVVEIGLLVALVLASAIAGILTMYPDAYQKRTLLRLPYLVFLLLAGLIAFQLGMPADVRMVIPQTFPYAMECTLCIGSAALIPAALLFMVLRKGASVHPFQAGIFAVLTASSIGCLTLRLSESNDSMMHLALSHYLPTLFFAALGAVVGKMLLKW